MKFFLTASTMMTVACCALSHARELSESPMDFIPWPQSLEISGGNPELKPQSRIVYTCAELDPLPKFSVSHGDKLGFIATRPYEFHPVSGEVDGLLMNVPHDEFGIGEYRTQFGDTITVTLKTGFKEGSIRYTTNGAAPDASSPAYEMPIELKTSGMVSARYFDQDNQASGGLWRRQFDHLDAQN